jgi:hypothetical protein
MHQKKETAAHDALPQTLSLFKASGADRYF